MTPADPATPNPARAAHLPPPEVWRACLLIAGSLVLSLLLLIPGMSPTRPGEPDLPLATSFLVFAFFGGLTLWLAFKTLQRRNWARWGLFAYLALSWLLGAQALAEDFSLAPFAGVIEGVCIAMEMAAIWGLFLGSGATWFTSGPAARQG